MFVHFPVIIAGRWRGLIYKLCTLMKPVQSCMHNTSSFIMVTRRHNWRQVWSLPTSIYCICRINQCLVNKHESKSLVLKVHLFLFSVTWIHILYDWRFLDKSIPVVICLSFKSYCLQRLSQQFPTTRIVYIPFQNGMKFPHGWETVPNGVKLVYVVRKTVTSNPLTACFVWTGVLMTFNFPFVSSLS